MVVWLIFTSLLAASPTLHKHFHETADQTTHQCAVTLLQQQQVLSAEPVVTVVESDFAVLQPLLPQQVEFVSQSDLRLLPTRGPPAVS